MPWTSRTRGTSRRSTPRCASSPRATPFDPEREDYLVHITTGTHVAQICLFLLTESRHFPARLLQTSPAKEAPRENEPGSYAIIDLDLSKYDNLATRFQKEKAEAHSFLKSGIETKNAAFNASSSASSRWRSHRARRSCSPGRRARARLSWRGASSS